jgi:uncharacterized membrane protein YccF (DUF307 family)
MLRLACVGLWLAVSASFALSAGIIGMPAGMIVFEIVRVTVWIGLAVGAFILGRSLVQDWRRDDNNASSA